MDKDADRQVTAMTDKDPSWISSYTMTQDTSEIIQNYGNKVENTCHTLIDDSSLQMAIEKSLATEITESKLKIICSSIKLEGEPEGRIHRSVYYYKKRILEETIHILAERIVLTIQKPSMVMQTSTEFQTALMLDIDKDWNIKPQVEQILLSIKQSVLSPYGIWSSIFGVSIDTLRKDLVPSITFALHQRRKEIETQLAQIFQDEFKETKSYLLSCSDSLKNISVELQEESIHMDISG